MRNQGLGSWIARRAGITPGKVALIFGGERWTYGQLDERITRLARGLSQLGVRAGDRVAYLGPNHPTFLEAMFATSALGAIFVPVNYRLGVPDLVYILDDAGSRVLLHASEVSSTVEEIRMEIRVGDCISVGGTAGSGSLLYENVLGDQPADPLDEPVGLDDVCLLPYTSGTTGRPKGVMLTHGNLTWNVANMLASADFLGSDVTLATAPLYRMGGLGVTVLETLCKGGTVVLMRTPDPKLALELIQRHKVTTLFGGPEILGALPSTLGWEETDLSSVRLCITGGAPVPEHLIRAFLEHGIPFLQGYGLTEAAPVALLLDETDMLRKVGSAGKPVFFTQVRVVHPDMSDVGVGEVGEVVIRGPNVMKGYWRRREATEEALAGGWLHSGDAARVDEEGFVYIVDRMKDAFTVGGVRVYPSEIEMVLREHPDVDDAAVVGIPNGEMGAVPAAFVVVKPGPAVSPDALREFADLRLSDHKRPRTLKFVEEIPRNAAGKILRARLVEMAFVAPAS